AEHDHVLCHRPLSGVIRYKAFGIGLRLRRRPRILTEVVTLPAEITVGFGLVRGRNEFLP
ncbi:MAG: hypothetical protein V5A49_05205, partial [Haloarcula sp.]